MIRKKWTVQGISVAVLAMLVIRCKLRWSRGGWRRHPYLFVSG